MPDLGQRVVLFGKIIDDKEEGVYIEDVYFGGLAETREEEEQIKRYCANNIKGGYAVTRTFHLGENDILPHIFVEARRRFHDIEREMFENEQIIEANIERARRKR